MTIQDKIDQIKLLPNYVAGSVYIKSSDDSGCVLKWLETNQWNTADRREMFLGTDELARVDGMKIHIFNREIISETIISNPI